MSGHLILLISVPGGGKGVLLEYLKGTVPQLTFAVSCTTRTPRPGEVEGKNYFFVSKEVFQNHIDAGDFVEWVEQDGGHMYGTLRSELLEPLTEGTIVVREVEVRGARAIRALVPPENLTVIFVDADGWEVLEQRIQSRAPISAEELAHRKERFETERLFISEADVVVHNYEGALDEAKRELMVVVQGVIARMENTRGV